MKKKNIILVIFITALLTALINLSIGYDHTAWRNFPVYLIYSVVFALGNAGFFHVLNKYLNWERSPVITFVLSVLGAIPVNAGIYFALSYFFRTVVFGQTAGEFFRRLNPLEYLVVVLFALVVSLIIISGFFIKAIKESVGREEALKTQNEQIRYERLIAQFDPHFLFNNLNVLTALIEENPAKAVDFSIALSGIYQYITAQKGRMSVPLQEELEFAEKYLNLLRMRFEEGLHYQMDVNGKEDFFIIPFSLQVLLENAVKHNEISTDNPLDLTLELRNEQLWVRNTIHSKPAAENHLKTGLDNLRKRYELQGFHLRVENGDKEFIVKLPLSKKP